MKLNPHLLVLAYLGYRKPVDDLSGYKTLVEIDSDMGILPGQREEDPYPASETPHGDQHGSSKTPGPEPQPSSEARFPVPPGEVREKQRTLPLPNSHPPQRDKIVDRFVFNVPDGQPDSRYREKTDVPVRTIPEKGEEYGHPTKFDYGMPTRRHEAKIGGFPKERQREQRGKAKRVSRKWYKQNRSRHKRRMQRRQRRLRTRAQYKRQRKLRQKFPRRFQRRPGGGVRSPAERTQEWRSEKKRKKQNRRADYIFHADLRELGMPFLFGPDLQYAELDSIDADAVRFTVFPEFEGEDFGLMGAPKRHEMAPLEFLANAVFDEDVDLEAVLEALEDVYGEEVWELPPEEVNSPWLDEEAVVASSLWHTHFYEQRAPELREKSDDERKDEQDAAEYRRREELQQDRLSGVPRGTRTTPTYPDAPDHWPSDQTRAPYWKGRPDDKIPATPLNLDPVEDSGGASKVIPWDYPGQNKSDRTFQHGPGQPPPGGLAASTKVADTISQIMRRTAPKVKQRAKNYSPRIIGRERSKGMWIFQTGDYIQRLRAIPTDGKAQNVAKMDVRVSCSCPFWRWQGPEHWAKKHDYLYNRNQTRGTASYPEIRDPNFKHGVCKHVAAVLSFVRSNRLKLPTKQANQKEGQTLSTDSLRYLLDRTSEVGTESCLTPDVLIRQYLRQT